MTSYWLAVVSKAHVQKGMSGGFAQVCHGKKEPLARMRAGDWLIYYSPGTEMGKSDLKSFTALGKITNSDIYQFKMTDTFLPYRREVSYFQTKEVSLESLKSQLALCQSRSWGMKLRRGLIEISVNDFEIIAQAMGYTV